MSSEELQKKVSTLLSTNKEAVWGLTAVYFVYVVLGGIHHGLHKHIYTGNENDSVFVRLRQGKPVTFREDVYDEFFSFKHYFTTYRIHVLTCGVWLLSGVYNLRNAPEFAGFGADKKPMFEGWYHKRLSGYAYVLSSLIKGVSASVISYRSRSLGYARYPMVVCGIYDVFTLYVAMRKLLVERNVAAHREWMIRNFGVGAGSIWVRVFAGVWAAYDLDFMKSADLYRKMNNVALCCGFLQGNLFSEWWLAKTPQHRRIWELLQALNVLACIAGARQVYRELDDEAQNQFKQTGVNPYFGLF